MNRKKGFRRIVFLCSMLMVVAGAFIGDKLSNNMPAMQEARRELRYAEQEKIGPFYFIDRWNGQKKWPQSVVRSHKILWKEWTGEELQTAEEPNVPVKVSRFRDLVPAAEWEKELLRIFEGPDIPAELQLEPDVYGQDKHLSAEQAAALLRDFIVRERNLIKPHDLMNFLDHYDTLERIAEPFWREQGWEQVNGRRLPYSPIKVSKTINLNRWAQASINLDKTRLYCALGGIVGGSISGFCIVWFTYLILGWLFSWVARGFCNTKENTKIQV